MINILSKLPNTGNTIFASMTRLAQEHEAINLSQGFPDFDTPPELLRQIQWAMDSGKNQYAPMQGVTELREQLASVIEDQYGAIYHPDSEITITSGATQALFTAITCLIRQDDEVICFDPAYDAYAPVVDLCGGVVKTVSQQAPDFNIDWNQVRKLFSHKTKLIIINTPQNPTGRCFSDEDMQELIRFTKGTDVFILSDEVYDQVVFDHQSHRSVCSYPELMERSFVVGSFGKTFHMTGWKIGYCLAPERLSTEFRKVHQYLVFSVNTPAQYGIAEFLKHPDHYRSIRDFYRQKRDRFAGGLEETLFRPLKCRGSYFLLADYRSVSELSDKEFCKKLCIDYGIAAIPLSAFYKTKLDQNLIRFCFAKKDETLNQAIEKLVAIKHID